MQYMGIMGGYRRVVGVRLRVRTEVEIGRWVGTPPPPRRRPLTLTLTLVLNLILYLLVILILTLTLNLTSSSASSANPNPNPWALHLLLGVVRVHDDILSSSCEMLATAMSSRVGATAASTTIAALITIALT